LTHPYNDVIVYESSILQTVEAEITAMMPLQRACDGENQARNKLSNGPLRAQSNVIFHRVFCDAAGKRINAGDMLVSC
jgi:hypothetical protein